MPWLQAASTGRVNSLHGDENGEPVDTSPREQTLTRFLQTCSKRVYNPFYSPSELTPWHLDGVSEAVPIAADCEMPRLVQAALEHADLAEEGLDAPAHDPYPEHLASLLPSWVEEVIVLGPSMADSAPDSAPPPQVHASEQHEPMALGHKEITRLHRGTSVACQTGRRWYVQPAWSWRGPRPYRADPARPAMLEQLEPVRCEGFPP